MIDIEAFRIKDGPKGDLSNVPVYPMINGHASVCAVHDEGPCTCGTEEELNDLAFEEAGLSKEDFE